MNTKKLLLIPIAIILFVIGAWPIALILIVLCFVPTTEKATPQKTIEDLERENEILRQELADQAVRHAMDKAESRKRKG